MPMRMAFKSITTDVNGLHPGHTLKVDRINRQTVKRMERRMKKVTNKFTRADKPTYQITSGIGEPPDAGGGPTGRSLAPRHLRARWAMSSTSNDPKFYYLEVGARRFRHMSPDWQSMTRPGAGLRTFRRAGYATALSSTQVGVIEPRFFAAAATKEEFPRFQAAVWEIFGKNAVYKFFGRVVIR